MDSLCVTSSEWDAVLVVPALIAVLGAVDQDQPHRVHIDAGLRRAALVGPCRQPQPVRCHLHQRTLRDILRRDVGQFQQFTRTHSVSFSPAWFLRLTDTQKDATLCSPTSRTCGSVPTNLVTYDLMLVPDVAPSHVCAMSSTGLGQFLTSTSAGGATGPSANGRHRFLLSAMARARQKQVKRNPQDFDGPHSC